MWLVRGGKQLGMAGRTPHGGLCLLHPTSVPLAPQPMGHCPTRGDHDGCPALGVPDVTHGASQEAGDSRAGQSRCGGSCATGLCHPHPCQLRGAAARSDATAPGLANASGSLHKRGEAGRQAGSARGCSRHVGHGDATLGMPGAGYTGVRGCGSPGMCRKCRQPARPGSKPSSPH